MNPRRISWRSIGLLTAAIAFVGMLAAVFFEPSPPRIPSADLLKQSRNALRRRDYTEAERLARQIPGDDPLADEALLICAEACTKDNRLTEAAVCYQKLLDSRSPAGKKVRPALADVLLHLGDLQQSIQLFQEVLQTDSEHSVAHSRLSFIYTATAQRWLSRPHLEFLLKSHQATPEELALLADLDRVVDHSDFLQQCAQQFPDDPNVRFGLADIAEQRGNIQEAMGALQQITAEHPQMMSAQALLGRILATEQSDRFEVWHSSLPGDADVWPDIWFARGLRSQFQQQPRMAARCFWETLRLAPNHRRAMFQLGRTLSELNDPHAAAVSERATVLLEVSDLAAGLLERPATANTSVRKLVDALSQTGRTWEACVWGDLAARSLPEEQWPVRFLQQAAPQLTTKLPLVTSEKNIAIMVDLSDLPTYTPRIQEMLTPESATADRTASLRFEAETSALPDFVYDNAADDATPGARMQEQTGGGVTVLDIDRDTHPDLYLVQGGHWPQDSDGPVADDQRADQLFRNRLGQQYTAITESASVHETGFGQSASAGDVNSDGFPDLYVANIGPNRLLVNNGDGTFSRITAPPSQSLNWTSSVAVVDVNDDGLADLVDVNYVSGADAYSRICHGRACSPATFPGTCDQVHLNTGDGAFQTITADVDAQSAKGLGVLVFRDPDTQTTSILVGNDQTPKYQLQLQPAESAGQWQLQDIALQTGLAYNGNGVSTAAMGIAADDVDHNGLPDFFVINFREEANTLSLQYPGGIFRDMARSAGVDVGGLNYVGWGTQFLDADRDGYSDLVMSNGHVDDYRNEGQGYQMRCQFFRSVGPGQFEELQGTTVGSFFDQEFHGRGLARLDWNGDGLMDFALSCSRSPAVLVTNRTLKPGHFLNVELIGTDSARDAFLTTVEITTDRTTLVKQLFAGDGYHACNQRCIQMGLGNSEAIESVRVRWPSGTETTITSPPVDCTLTCVEGREAAYALEEGTMATLPSASTQLSKPQAGIIPDPRRPQSAD
ncbi:MAG: VCBS repeat-containing protein [Planctomycetaceae bacterium]|nr:VCBS repeat-containing protein [Planctomycetaceae bacterium]